MLTGERSVADPVAAVDVRARLRLVEAGVDAEPADRAPQRHVRAAVAVVDLVGDAVAVAQR